MTANHGARRGDESEMLDEQLPLPAPRGIAEAQERIPDGWRVVSSLSGPTWAVVHAVKADYDGPGLFAPWRDQAIFRFGDDPDMGMR